MDYRPALRATTGIGRYAASLAAALAAGGELDLRLFGVFHKGNRRALRKGPPGARLVAWPLPSRLVDALGRAGILPADRLLGGCDLFHYTNYILPVVSARTPKAMTVHDLAFLRDPSCHTGSAQEGLSNVMARAVRECRVFLAPSESTARDCEEFLRLPRERIFVTPLGVGPEFFARAPAAPEPGGPPYLLAVGTLEPRKNHPRLIRAAARVPGVELRIAGKRGWLYDETEKAARSGGATLLGHVSEPRLRALMAGAAAIVYPSLLEGFGLPVLEAMAMGRPVLTSNRPPLSELAGDGALLVDPEDEDAIAEGIRRILHDGALRAELARRGPARARRFTWEACAEATRRAYEAALS